MRIVADEMRIERRRVDDAGTTSAIDEGSATSGLRTPLAGAHQAANLAFSLGDARRGRRPVHVARRDAARRGSRAVRLPGRFQHVGRWIFDVAHNPDGAEVLARDTIDRGRAAAPIPVAVLCVLGDKDWRAMMDALAPVVSIDFILTDRADGARRAARGTCRGARVRARERATRRGR